MNYHPENDITEDEQAYWEEMAEKLGRVDAIRLVRLLKCGRKSCSHVLTDDERKWRQDPKWELRWIAICPKCGSDGFYALNAAGQVIISRDLREKAFLDIDPATIEPSSRLGPKMKARILDAKRRALGFQQNTKLDAPLSSP